MKIALLEYGGWDFVGSGESEWRHLGDEAKRAVAQVRGAASAKIYGSLFKDDPLGVHIADLTESAPLQHIDPVPLYVKVLIEGEGAVRIWVPKG